MSARDIEDLACVEPPAAETSRDRGAAIELIVAQLTRIIGETDTAASSIVHALGRVDSSATRLTDTLRETMRSFEGLQRSWSNEAGEANASHELERHATAQSAARAQFEDRARALKTKLGHLASTGKTARELALEAKILALNSKIEAARLGASAAGFSVIAGEMSRISGSSKQVSEEIEDAVELASSVLEQQSTAREHEAATLGGLVQRQRELITEYEALKLSYETALLDIDASSRTLAGAISDALAQIQFQDIVRQRVEHLIRGLEALGSDSAGWSDVIAMLAESYKMSTERAVHEATTGESLGIRDTNRKIELF